MFAMHLVHGSHPELFQDKVHCHSIITTLSLMYETFFSCEIAPFTARNRHPCNLYIVEMYSMKVLIVLGVGVFHGADSVRLIKEERVNATVERCSPIMV